MRQFQVLQKDQMEEVINTNQVPLCDLKAVFLHKLYDFDDSLAHK